jgi:KaiC/GvpD/RAD55 family RecA-like ATPase
VTTVAQGKTDFAGEVTFGRTPAGNYTVFVSFLNSQSQTYLSVNASRAVQVSISTPYRNEMLIAFLVIVASSTSIVVVRRRGKLYPQSFVYFSSLTMGGLPDTCFTSITGNSGSGKSVLLESLAAEHLRQGKGCVYIVNTEYPSKIRENMVSLGMPSDDAMNSQKLLFVDSYSAIGGTASKEDYYVSSHTDLTGLGMRISSCLEKLGPGTDVYLDSIMPLLTALRVDYLLNFLQSIAAKVKANDGKLCLTVGAAIEKTDMAKLEEASDCVIETQLQESGKGQRRRLRIKKLRGKPYIDKWTSVQIQTEKGIVFFTKAKPEALTNP